MSVRFLGQHPRSGILLFVPVYMFYPHVSCVHEGEKRVDGKTFQQNVWHNVNRGQAGNNYSLYIGLYHADSEGCYVSHSRKLLPRQPSWILVGQLE